MSEEFWIPVLCLVIVSMINRVSINENSIAIKHLWNRMDEETKGRSEQ